MSEAEFSRRVEDAIAKTQAALADGFDAADVAVLVREAVEAAEALDDLAGTEKRQFAIEFVCGLVDKFFASATPQIEELVERIDWPLLPDAIEESVIDPWVKKLAVPYARDLLKLSIPSMVDLVVDATKGAVDVNRDNGVNGVSFPGSHA